MRRTIAVFLTRLPLQILHQNSKICLASRSARCPADCSSAECGKVIERGAECTHQSLTVSRLVFSAPQPLTVPPAPLLTVSRLVSQALNVFCTSPHQIHGLNISNNVTPLLAICTENKIEHELVVCNLMEGCVPASALCVNLAV